MVTCLLDTNVLLYLANPAALQHAAASRAVKRILRDGGRRVLTPLPGLAGFGRRPSADALGYWLAPLRG
jgi:predicted nucleic acid-binding protein